MRALIRFFKFTALTLALTMLAAALVLVYSRYIEPYALEIETVEISSTHVGQAADGIRILMFADTHLGEFYDLEDFKTIIGKINEQDPDIVIFAGDLIDIFDEYSEGTEELSALLSEINAPYGKYCVFGNHDYGGGAERQYPQIMASGGFTLLLNEKHYIEELGINIIGIDDILIGYGDIGAAGLSETLLFNIVVAHEPDTADAISAFDVDLMLAAHTHGRQINIKYLDEYILPPYGKNYIAGRYDFESERNMTLYVTRGIGMTQLPLRFNSNPELSVLVLRQAPPQ